MGWCCTNDQEGREKWAGGEGGAAKPTEVTDPTLRWCSGVCVCIKGPGIFTPHAHHYDTNALSLSSSLLMPSDRAGPSGLAWPTAGDAVRGAGRNASEGPGTADGLPLCQWRLLISFGVALNINFILRAQRGLGRGARPPRDGPRQGDALWQVWASSPSAQRAVATTTGAVRGGGQWPGRWGQAVRNLEFSKGTAT